MFKSSECCVNATLTPISSLLEEPSLSTLLLFEEYQLKSRQSGVEAVYICGNMRHCAEELSSAVTIEQMTEHGHEPMKEKLSHAMDEHSQIREREIIFCSNPIDKKCKGFVQNSANNAHLYEQGEKVDF